MGTWWSSSGEGANHSAPISDRTEDSYVMRMLTSPPVVFSHRGRRIVAISPEEIATRMLDWTVPSSPLMKNLNVKWPVGADGCGDCGAG